MSLNAREGKAVRPSLLPCGPKGTPLPGHTGPDPAPGAALHPSAPLGTWCHGLCRVWEGWRGAPRTLLPAILESACRAPMGHPQNAGPAKAGHGTLVTLELMGGRRP